MSSAATRLPAAAQATARFAISAHTLERARPFCPDLGGTAVVPLALEEREPAGEPDATLLDRAARLRVALIAGAITKYNLSGEAPAIPAPPGRRVILVPGQVEDDAAMLRGGSRIRTNLDLLRAVRRENPDGFILYKPHPDVEAGMRRGAVPVAEATSLADRLKLLTL